MRLSHVVPLLFIAAALCAEDCVTGPDPKPVRFRNFVVNLMPIGNQVNAPYIQFNAEASVSNTPRISGGHLDSVTWQSQDTDRAHHISLKSAGGDFEQTINPRNSGKPSSPTWGAR